MTGDEELASSPVSWAKQASHHGGTGYPQVRLLTPVACGTRTLIDAVFGPATLGETTYAPRLGPRMILLAERDFGAQRLLADIAATGSRGPGPAQGRPPRARPHPLPRRLPPLHVR